jgi:outer membrane protein OmpA-like peptidoglycan-associated protein
MGPIIGYHSRKLNLALRIESGRLAGFTGRRVLLAQILAVLPLLCFLGAPVSLGQESSGYRPEPTGDGGCPQLASVPQLPMTEVVSCHKGDSVEVTFPLTPDSHGQSRDRKVTGAYEFREYHLPQGFNAEQAFENLTQLLPMAGLIVKYSYRPSTIVGRNGDLWVLINVNDDLYNVSTIRDAEAVCAGASSLGDIARQMTARNRVSIAGVQFSGKNQLDSDASGAALEALHDYLKQNPTASFFIESHKVSTGGTEDDDFELSRQRANAVVNWLVAHGIPAEHLQGKPWGRMQPETDNQGESEIQCNERIQLVRRNP